MLTRMEKAMIVFNIPGTSQPFSTHQSLTRLETKIAVVDLWHDELDVDVGVIED